MSTATSQAESDSQQPEVRITLVITLRNGVQIRNEVQDATVRKSRGTDELVGIEWTLTADPFGNSIEWIDVKEVVAVHCEREPS